MFTNGSDLMPSAHLLWVLIYYVKTWVLIYYVILLVNSPSQRQFWAHMAVEFWKTLYFEVTCLNKHFSAFAVWTRSKQFNLIHPNLIHPNKIKPVNLTDPDWGFNHKIEVLLLSDAPNLSGIVGRLQKQNQINFCQTWRGLAIRICMRFFLIIIYI